MDYIIVGQGLAGSLMAYFLRKEGKQVVVVDNGNPRASSKVAAGIVNPITGRHYVKSWKFDDLLPFAKTTYAQIEAELGVKLFHERTLIRSIFAQREVNRWLEKTDVPSYSKYVLEETGLGTYDTKVEKPYYTGRLKGAGQVDIPLFIKEYRTLLKKENALIEEEFDFKALKIEGDKVNYKMWTASKLIFCEGWRAVHNPYFDWVGYEGAKGEVLLVEFPGNHFQEILKHKTFVVPLANNKYWVGATNKRFERNENPTEEKRTELLQKLDAFIKVPYRLIEHQAAIRPTIKDRKPVIGLHPKHATLAIFNGLGTKGATLGPYFAKQFVNYLLKGGVLDQEIQVGRFLDAN